MAFNKLLFGTSGIPLSTPQKGRSTATGIQQVNQLGLDAMELEFVQSVNIKLEKAPEVKKIAEESEVALTCHGQYFINLASLEKEKIPASIKRILNAATVANACGGYSMTFHAAFYQKQDPQKVYDMVKTHMTEVMQNVKDAGLKKSDMNYKDLLKTLKEFNCAGVLICESPNIEQDALLLKKYYYEL